MRIALVGTRGIPANYGGFETFAEELSTRLVERGHQVTVYCREARAEPLYRGVRLQYLPTIRHKYFETIAHTAVSTWHLLRHRPLSRCTAMGPTPSSRWRPAFWASRWRSTWTASSAGARSGTARRALGT